MFRENWSILLQNNPSIQIKLSGIGLLTDAAFLLIFHYEFNNSIEFIIRQIYNISINAAIGYNGGKL